MSINIHVFCANLHTSTGSLVNQMGDKLDQAITGESELNSIDNWRYWAPRHRFAREDEDKVVCQERCYGHRLNRCQYRPKRTLKKMLLQILLLDDNPR